MRFFLGLVCTSVFVYFGAVFAAPVAAHVEVRGAELFIDGQRQPQLFGAEIQYFRLRGGPDRNIPRQKVIELWARALDRAVEARMNAISFYIPWDFHEYAEGKFDFDGTVDEDGDGLPDYPSRDVKTFMRMALDRGLNRIMVRPGPYINAEWGFLGFGAIPLWFHLKYPDSHMRSPEGFRTRLYDYHNPDFLRHTRIWFDRLHSEVLKGYIGSGKPIVFLQVDNETNFLWSPVYHHDYGTPNVERYREFLRQRYSSLANLNQKHGRKWSGWDQIRPPVTASVNVAEDQDWYRFEDESIYLYLGKIRRMWEDLGVKEPDVLFTLADSFNAPSRGLLPNYKYRDKTTGLLTVNLYPKTEETPAHPFLNNPFKADSDVISADAAAQHYFGKGNHWVMGPEIQGGWWKGTPVETPARQQTYLSVLGHGLKGIFVYYFNEGDNWGWDWPAQQVRPFYDSLRTSPAYASIPEDRLPDQFWSELQQTVNREIVFGWNVRELIRERDKVPFNSKLFFDAPLDADAQPRQHFFHLKEIGEKVISPYADWLGRATADTDPVCIVKDNGQNPPSSIAALPSVEMQSTWHAGLVGYLLHAGIRPRIIHWDLGGSRSLGECGIVIHQDNGIPSDGLARELKKILARGKTVVNLIGDSLAVELGVNAPGMRADAKAVPEVVFSGGAFKVMPELIFQYRLGADARCSSVFTYGGDVRGYKCRLGKGEFYQLGAVFYREFNANEYAEMRDSAERVTFLNSLLSGARVEPRLKLEGDSDRVVAFSRSRKGRPQRWITVKSGRNHPVRFSLRLTDADERKVYRVKDLMGGSERIIKGAELRSQGFPIALSSLGSGVFWLDPEQLKASDKIAGN